MVLVPSTISDGCSKMAATLQKLQPKTGCDPMCTEASLFLNQCFPGMSKKVDSMLSKQMKATSACNICECSLGNKKVCLVRFNVDYDDRVYTPSSIVVTCSECAEICSWSKLMSVIMNDAMLEPEMSGVSLLVERFLKVNGHRASDITVFNAAVSVMTSLKISSEQLKLTLQVSTDSLDSLFTTLVSH